MAARLNGASQERQRSNMEKGGKAIRSPAGHFSNTSSPQQR
jgi:hypothetical protein